MRQVTRETITNEMDFRDFGFQLGCSQSTIEQKLHDHPRNIELASYMLVSDWWESSQDTREEKSSALLGGVRSIGKHTTAVRLEQMLGERMLANPQNVRSISMGTIQPSVANPNTVGHSTQQYAIENLNREVQIHGSTSISNIDSTGGGAVGGSSEDSRDGPIIESLPESQGSVRNNQIQNSIRRRQVRSFGDYFGSVSQVSQVARSSRSNSPEKMSKAKYLDIFEGHDGHNGALSETNIKQGLEGAIGGAGVYEQVSHTDEIDFDIFVKAPAQTGAMNGQPGAINDQTGAINDQTGAMNDQTGAMNDQTGAMNGQPGAINDQTGAMKDQTGAMNDQTGDMNSQTGDMNSQTGAVNGQIKNASGKAKNKSGFLKKVFGKKK